ncbi:Ail/Lom family outer membrane beta-barrel protein [Shigella dysenteriae]|nr:Ail/Lom family outer membrane beta-barrel protein [Shigella dysenteriae]
MSGSAFAVTHHAFSSGAGRTSDGNGSHASTLKSPSYTKSVSWQHYRVNEWFSAYAMAGVAYSRVSTFSGDYLRVTDNKGKTHDVLTGSDDGRHSNTSLAWGAGVQFNPTESVAVDLAYEGSGSGDWRTDAFIVGIGYRF